MDKVIQLPLPLVWWADIEKWRVRHTVDNVKRPTEDAALDNVYYAARLAKGLRLGTKLSKLEQHLYRLERQAKLIPAYATESPFERAKWIFSELEKDITTKRGKVIKANPFKGKLSGVRHVLAILDDISYAMRGYAQYEAILEQQQKVAVLKDVLNEVTAEQVARAA